MMIMTISVCWNITPYSICFCPGLSVTMTAPVPETSWGLFSVNPDVAEKLAGVTLHNTSLGSIDLNCITMLGSLMRSVTSASVSKSQGTRGMWLLMGLQVRGKNNILGRIINREISDNSFDVFF
jgi:hypothetical protein